MAQLTDGIFVVPADPIAAGIGAGTAICNGQTELQFSGVCVMQTRTLNEAPEQAAVRAAIYNFPPLGKRGIGV